MYRIFSYGLDESLDLWWDISEQVNTQTVNTLQKIKEGWWKVCFTEVYIRCLNSRFSHVEVFLQ